MNKLLAGLGLGWLALVIASFAAWITHVVVCIKAASWVFLVAGAIFAPIGVVHGIGVWFGIF
ncbi:hypothetical protein POP15_037 [Pectobacterium phage POP15]|nr:hypothetical protein POP15_037 [Pectobacterium phage POP15]